MVLTKSRSWRRLWLRLRLGRSLAWALRWGGALVSGGCNECRIAAARETAAAYVGAGGLLKGKKDGGDSASYHSDQASKFINGVWLHAWHLLLQSQKFIHTVCQSDRYRCEAAGSTRVLALALFRIVLTPQWLLDFIQLLSLLSAYLPEWIRHGSLPVLIQNRNPVNARARARISIDNHAAAASACDCG